MKPKMGGPLVEIWLLLILVAMATSVAQDRCPYPPVLDYTDLRMSIFQDGSRQFYRYMTFDSSRTYLYIGAMERVYKLRSDGISQNWVRSDELVTRDEDKNLCDPRRPTTKDIDCRNHIRNMVINNDRLHVCGTGGYYPMKFDLDPIALTIKDTYPPQERNTGMLLCPYSPSDTSAFISTGSTAASNRQIFTGTILRAYRTDYIISRPNITDTKINTRTSIQTESRNAFWLDGVEFIATFETNDYVYFFFNEIGLELSDCKKGETREIATVARICKSDPGGSQNILSQTWTTFVKSRLNCSVTENDQFTKLRDVQKYSDRYFSLFWREIGYANGSAVCVFTQEDLDRAFDGPFQEYENDKWIEVPSSRVPVTTTPSGTVRPGQCYPSDVTLSDDMQYFIKSHTLMHNSVNALENSRLYHFNNIFYDKLAVDFYSFEQVVYWIFYLPVNNSGQGEIHKYVSDYFSDKSKTIAKWKVYDGFHTLWQMLLMNSQLYLSTDYQVLQLPVAQCVYKHCDDCVQDPHCGWDSAAKSCKPFERSLVQSVFGDPMDVCTCQDQPASTHVLNSPGQTVLLPCRDTLCCPLDGIRWTVNGSPIVTRDKYLMTSSGWLIVQNVTGNDEGNYACYSKNSLIQEHYISIPDNKCKFVPTLDKLNDTMIDMYTNWRADVESYGEEFNHWIANKENAITVDGATCPKTDVSSCQRP